MEIRLDVKRLGPEANHKEFDSEAPFDALFRPMQKLKKALKKLAGIKSKASPAMAAKKASNTKKKTQSAGVKKAGPAKKAAKKAAKPAVKAKAAAKPSKADAKKDLKKKAAAAAPKAAGKAVKPAQATAKAVKPAKEAKTPAKEAKATKTPQAAPADAKPPKGKKAREEAAVAAAPEEEEEIVLLDAEGRRYCRVKDCDQAAVVDGGYCRYHYLLFWKNIQNRKKILSEGKLERYIEELTARYPDKYLDMLRKDLRTEKEFMAAIAELEIDEAAVDSEFEDEAQNYLDEVRGMGGGTEETSSRDDDF